MGWSQVFRYTSRFDCSQVDEVSTGVWNLTGQSIDLTGSYTGLDVDTNCIIFQRGYDVNGKMVYDPYRVTGVISQGVTDIVVKVVADWPGGILNSSGYPYTGSFPIATSVMDTLKLINRTSFYLNQIDPDYEAALDNYNLYWLTSLGAAYIADSAAIKDTLDAHNLRINAEILARINADLLKRNLNNHDSLSTLDEKSYNSLTDKPTIPTGSNYFAKADSNTNANAATKKYVDGGLATKQPTGSYRTMTNHDSLSKLDEKSYESLTSKPVLTVTQDLPYSSVISLDSSDIVLTAGQGLKLTQVGNEIITEKEVNWEKETTADAENNWVIPFQIRPTSVIIYNGTPLRSGQWSGSSTTTLTVAVAVKKYDHLILIN